MSSHHCCTQLSHLIWNVQPETQILKRLSIISKGKYIIVNCHYHKKLVKQFWFFCPKKRDVIITAKNVDFVNGIFVLVASEVINSPSRSLHKCCEQKHSFTSMLTWKELIWYSELLIQVTYFQIILFLIFLMGNSAEWSIF